MLLSILKDIKNVKLKTFMYFEIGQSFRVGGRDTRPGPVDGSVSLTTENYRVNDRVNKVIKKSGYRNRLHFLMLFSVRVLPDQEQTRTLFFRCLSKNEREPCFSVRV